MDGPARAPSALRSDWIGVDAGERAAAASTPLRAIAGVTMLAGLAMVLWALPVPSGIGRPGLYAALAGVALFGRYLRVSRALALAMLPALVALGAAVAQVHAWLGAERLLAAGLALLAAGLAVAAARARRHRRPLLAAVIGDAWLGPAWLVDAVVRRTADRWLR